MPLHLKVISLIALICSTPSSHAANQRLSNSETNSLLERIAERQPRTPIKIEFRETRTSSLFKTPITSEGVLYFNSPNQFRKENTTTPQSIVISDGNTLWMYYPAFKEVETYSLEGKNPIATQLSNFLACLDLQVVREKFSVEAWKHSDGYKLSLVPKHRKTPISVTVTLDLNHSLRPVTFSLRTAAGDVTQIELKSEKPFTPPTDFFILNQTN